MLVHWVVLSDRESWDVCTYLYKKECTVCYSEVFYTRHGALVRDVHTPVKNDIISLLKLEIQMQIDGEIN